MVRINDSKPNKISYIIKIYSKNSSIFISNTIDIIFTLCIIIINIYKQKIIKC